MFNDPLHDIKNYSPTLTIKQLLTFCERKELDVTRAMVQNYIRDGLMPPPNGRLYSQKHLAALVVIARLKTVFDIPTIKKVIAPFLDEEGLPLELYEQIIQVINEANGQWEKAVAPVFAQVKDAGILSEMMYVSFLKKRVQFD